MSTECKDTKLYYTYQAKNQYKDKPLTGDISIKMDLYFGTKRKCDIDNFNKLVFDALTGIVYEDDSQIVELSIIKGYDKANPRVELCITNLV